MSILIKGMEMPESCTRCDYLGLNVAIGCPVMTGVNGRATDCPLIEVPPHGRLGDLDVLIEKVIAKYLEHERKGELVFAAAEIKQDIVDLISDAAAVIPADKDGEA